MRPFVRIYGNLIKHADRVAPVLMGPFCLSTVATGSVFFQGPVIKRCIVLAGLGDVIRRPTNFITKKQYMLLPLSGALWGRGPIKTSKCSFVACNTVLSVSRIMLLWRAFDDEWKKWQKEKSQIDSVKNRKASS